jgi:hypothetical protein
MAHQQDDRDDYGDRDPAALGDLAEDEVTA